MKGVLMDIDVEEYISIPEATQDFSRVARLVDKKGTVIILKDNAPRYIIQDYDVFSRDVVARDDEADTAASRILAKHIKAFEELAK
jgi:antitoxin Phd